MLGFRTISARPAVAFCRFLSTSNSTKERGSGATFKAKPRKIQKVFHPATMEEIPLALTGLEGNRQAREVAQKAAEKLGKARFTVAGRAGLSEDLESKEGGRNIFQAKGDHLRVENGENILPEGMSFKDLPRFKKIHGWDKDSKQLKNLCLSLSRLHKSDDTVVVEGKRLITDAMRAGLHPSVFVFSRLNLLAGLKFDLTKELAMYQIPYRNIKAWSELKTPPGIMAAFSRDSIQKLARERQNSHSSLPLTLILDNIRGPDNLGALLRVAAAAGCRQVICTKGCADPWQDKAVRAAAGAHLVIPVAMEVPWDSIHMHLKAGVSGSDDDPVPPQVLLADIARADEASEREESLDPTELSRRLSRLEERCLSFRNQFVRTGADPQSVKPRATGGDLDCDEWSGKDEDEIREILKKMDEARNTPGDFRDFSYYEADLVQEYAALPLPSRSFRDVQLYGESNREVVVVIGGETEGLSASSKKLAHSHLGERVFVPTQNGVDSLNVASAAGIILYEVAGKLQKGNFQ